jgi:hypothetical protein
MMLTSLRARRIIHLLLKCEKDLSPTPHEATYFIGLEHLQWCSVCDPTSQNIFHIQVFLLRTFLEPHR